MGSSFIVDESYIDKMSGDKGIKFKCLAPIVKFNHLDLCRSLKI
jgi:hypothetical protein